MPRDLQALASKVQRDPAFERLLINEIAQKSLLDFAAAVYPEFEAPPHIVFLAKLLEDMESGKGKRNICISIPVRHGKSVLCSQIFPAWYLGRHSRDQIILASHAETLAVLHSREAKAIVEGEKWPWPELQMSLDSAAVGRWNLKKGGGFYAVGVGGSVTGRGADVLIVDDALHDGHSIAERNSTWDWFKEKLAPRAEPGCKKIVIGARFASDDVPGRIHDDEADLPNWTFYDLPGLAVDGDLLGRKPGEALWPSRWPVEELEKKRLGMTPRAFEAQVQQNPLPEGGLTFSADWFEQRYDLKFGPNGQLIEPERIIIKKDFFGNITSRSELYVCQSIDSAWKDGPSNDFSVIATWAMDDIWYYLLDVWRDRVLFPKLLEKVKERADLWTPRAIFVEEAQSGLAVIQTLKMSTRLPIIGIRPTGSKEERAENITGPFAAGKVKLPRNAPWLHEWLKEHLEFPGGGNKKDDQVDTTSLALGQMMAMNLRSGGRAGLQKITARYQNWMER